MANQLKLDKGTIIVTPTKKGFSMKFATDGGKEPSISTYKPENDQYNGVRGIIYREQGLPVKLETEAGEVIFDFIEKREQEATAKVTEASPVPILDDSYNLAHTLLPDNTRLALKGLTSPDNFHLKLFKCARFDDREKKFTFFKLGRNKEDQFSIKSDFSKLNFTHIHARYLKSISGLGFSDEVNHLVETDVSANWRWAVGLGNASVYENGITLHHVYGFPYIPGSGVKGMTRTWIINECFGYEKDSEDRALQNLLFKAIFGYGKQDNEEGQKGSIYFFDALPTEAPEIAPDVMNNHYQDYYEGKSPPADWLSPNPIFFLSVKGGKYRFQLGYKPLRDLSEKISGFKSYESLIPDRLKSQIVADTSLLDFTKLWLMDALANHGIGAKTAVGYGIFE